ncbi:hypothetical protein T05_12752 [Trichinella murrelli]|uniref:Uncharacterized protein n=1 Tax=Trichinella murrelli TaxID=144512 RepID=A0A0V0TA24_9BILA|nr:hypothetical protein T05_12752 [Trichinella murrelli]
MAVYKVLLMLPFVGVQKVIREVFSGSAEFLFCMGLMNDCRKDSVLSVFRATLGNEHALFAKFESSRM